MTDQPEGGLTVLPIGNPPAVDSFGRDDDMATGPMPGSGLPCGCHIRRPDYETVLCAEHLAELNSGRTDRG